MFDILVDTKKKRRLVFLMVVVALLLLTLSTDLIFCLQLKNHTSISSLFQACLGLQTGFYSKLVVLLMSAQKNLLISFTTFDWISFICLFFLGLSHHHKESRYVLYLGIGVYFVRFLSIGLIGAYLLKLASSQMVGNLVVAIHLCVMILLVITVLLCILVFVLGFQLLKSYRNLFKI